MTETEKSIRTVKDAILISGRPTITGALLGELIKRVAPDLDVRGLINMPTGSGSVSKFAEVYLQGVLSKSGKQGSDLLYTIAIGENNCSSALLTDDGSTSHVWQEFVRPKSLYHIIFQPVEGDDPRLYLASKIPEGAFKIANATYDELDEIRANFTKIANEIIGSADAPALIAEGPYKEWSEALKKRGKGLYRQWVGFRIDGIIKLFDLRLISFGIDEQKRQRLCEKLRHSQRQNKGQSNANATGENAIHTALDRTADTPTKHDSDLQSIVIQAIRSLTDAEIRDLRIPVGALWDAIKANK